MIPAGIVLYHPDADLLDELLANLDIRERRLFLFINEQIDPAIEQRLSHLSNAHIMRSKTNQGLGTALNEIVGAADNEGFKKIVLFDQDSTPDLDLPERLAQRCTKLESQSIQLAVVGPRLIPPENEGYKPLRYQPRSDSLPSPDIYVDFIPTSGSVISVIAWKKIGPFRNDFFIDGIDVEWGYRTWHHEYTCILADDIRMVHRWGLPQKTKNHNQPQITRLSNVRTYYYLRNSVYSLKLPHIPRRAKIQQVLRLGAQSLAIVTSRRLAPASFRLIWRAISAGLSGRLGPAPHDLTPRKTTPS